MRSHFGLRGLERKRLLTRAHKRACSASYYSFPPLRPLIGLNNDCLQKYGLTALTKIKKIAPLPPKGGEKRGGARGEGDGQKLPKIKENYH